MLVHLTDLDTVRMFDRMPVAWWVGDDLLFDLGDESVHLNKFDDGLLDQDYFVDLGWDLHHNRSHLLNWHLDGLVNFEFDLLKLGSIFRDLSLRYDLFISIGD